MHTRPMLAAAAATLLLALAAGCGGDDDGGDEASPTTAGPAPTAAPATTAPPSSTTAAAGEVVLAETFDDDANRWSPESFDTDTATGEIADGQMTFSVSESPSAGAPEGQVALPTLFWPSAIEGRADQLSDVRVDTTVSFTEGAQVGVSCRIVDPTGDDFRSYDFAISSAGVASISEVDEAGSPEQLARAPEMVEGAEPALPDDPAFEYDPAQAYELGAECRGGQDGGPVELTLFLDGAELLTAEDAEDPIPTGIASANYGESTLLTQLDGFTPFGVAFDDWTLTELGAS